MALETKTKIIDGHNVAVTQLPARKAIMLKARLARTLGPALGKFGDGWKGNLMDSELDISGAIEKLFQSLPEDDIEPLIFILLRNVFIDEKDVSNPDIFDNVFTEDLMLLYKTIGFMLEVNFKSFLDKIGIGKLLSPSPQTISQNDSKPDLATS